MDLSQYNLVDENSDYIILQHNSNSLLYVYKEYEIPKFIGKKQILPNSQLIEILENRRQLDSSNLIQLTDYVITSRLCLLYEQYIKNFEEELSKRRNTNQYWSEEELYNTFQACLSSMKSFHDFGLSHTCISPNSIVFSQDSQVILADHFVVTQQFKRNYSHIPNNEEYGYWSPEIINEFQGWNQKYETIEADIWALGIVFLEAMTLKSGYDFYFIDDKNKLYIDYQLIQDNFEVVKEFYSQELITLVQIMLTIDPQQRTWENIIEQNIRIQDMQQQQMHPQIQPIPEESEEESIVQENIGCDKNKLLNMLESCLIKSKQLIKENESRKSKRNSQEKIISSQSTPPKEKEDVHSSLLMLLKGKYSRKNSIDSSGSILKDIPQNKQKQRRKSCQDIFEKIVLHNPIVQNENIMDPNDLSNLMKIYKTYRGEGKNKMMHGKGHLVFQNGAVLQGCFKDGKINGYGILLINGQLMVGHWENNILIQIM
ncbi:unnamed protein product [Paramecium pentaurelia]|uniref:Protein kinase domain-containing protein n=1 Tax=Paramecium pentaurelia TaxID=43138 RepID=A0A8S1S7B4_9CILI|nr:unnamed protein product [Paramecium pentaurelia]